MNDFEKHMTQYWAEEYPDVWSFLWSPEEAEKIPTEHKDQIHFLNENGTKLINEFLDSSKMTHGLPYEPFKKYFKTIDEFRVTEKCDSEIKKWLYNKGIPFSKYVFIDCDRSGQSVMLTWKMVIKYWEGIFFADHIVIFDSSLEWGLFYYHESELYFGTDVIFDRKAEEQKTIELNELIKKNNYRQQWLRKHRADKAFRKVRTLSKLRFQWTVNRFESPTFLSRAVVFY